MKPRARIEIAVAALLCGLFLCVARTPAAEMAANPTATPCLHLLRGGQRYSLLYFGQRCTHQGHTPLPEEQYDALASWAFNASHAKILSQLNRYEIFARLSTLDLRGEKGFSHGPCNYGPWADYKWAHHAAQAFYGVSDCLGATPVVTDSLVKPLLKLGLARKDRYSILEFKESSKLSGAKRSRLVTVFSGAENSLSTERPLLAVPLTLDQAAKEKPAYESARRKTFGEFSILRD
jgi:hypothetical protein